MGDARLLYPGDTEDMTNSPLHTWNGRIKGAVRADFADVLTLTRRTLDASPQLTVRQAGAAALAVLRDNNLLFDALAGNEGWGDVNDGWNTPEEDD
jgi:hypothetical protein